MCFKLTLSTYKYSLIEGMSMLFCPKQGDSGGGIFSDEHLVGIVSYGELSHVINIQRSCVEKILYVYIKMSQLLPKLEKYFIVFSFPGYECGLPNYPGIYTNVFQYKRWIRATAKASKMINSSSIVMLIIFSSLAHYFSNYLQNIMT